MTTGLRICQWRRQHGDAGPRLWHPRPLLQRMLDDPDLYRYLQQVCYLTAYFFNEAYLDARIDEVRDLIARRSMPTPTRCTPAPISTDLEADLTGSGPGPMGGQTYGLKPFVTNRAAYIAGELDCSTLSIGDERTGLDRLPQPRLPAGHGGRFDGLPPTSPSAMHSTRLFAPSKQVAPPSPSTCRAFHQGCTSWRSGPRCTPPPEALIE